MRLLLVRHGESEWNAAGRLQGQADPPLSNLGRHQAARAAARLVDEPIDAIVSSDLVRASATARALADAIGMPVTERVDLREVDLGSWTGAAREEIEAAIPTPGAVGESRASRAGMAASATRTRWSASAARWRRSRPSGTAARSSRSATAAAFVWPPATCSGMPASELGRIMSIGNASITEFLVESDGGGRIVRLNDMAHLLDTTTADDLEPSATTEFEALG